MFLLSFFACPLFSRRIECLFANRWCVCVCVYVWLYCLWSIKQFNLISRLIMASRSNIYIYRTCCTTQILQLSKRVSKRKRRSGIQYPDWQTILDFFVLFFAFSCLFIARVKLNQRIRRGETTSLPTSALLALQCVLRTKANNVRVGLQGNALAQSYSDSVENEQI